MNRPIFLYCSSFFLHSSRFLVLLIELLICFCKSFHLIPICFHKYILSKRCPPIVRIPSVFVPYRVSIRIYSVLLTDGTNNLLSRILSPSPDYCQYYFFQKTNILFAICVQTIVHKILYNSLKG